MQCAGLGPGEFCACVSQQRRGRGIGVNDHVAPRVDDQGGIGAVLERQPKLARPCWLQQVGLHYEIP